MAAPRSVAILNGAHDQNAGAELARDLRAALDMETALRPLRAGELARALEESLPPMASRQERLAAARSTAARATDALVRMQYRRVFDQLEEAEELLLAVAPGPDVSRRLANLAFLRAIVLLRDDRTAQALDELRAVRRLDPQRPELDPSRYPPQIVRLFAIAGTAVSPTAALRVTAAFDGATVYIDGLRSGSTPALTYVSPGVHYVTGIFPGDHAIGERVTVAPGQTVTVKLRLTRVTVDDRARYVRRQLLDGAPIAPSGGEAVRQAASRAAALSSVEVVIVVGDDQGGVLWTSLYEASSGRLGKWRRVKRNGEARDVFWQLGLITLPPLRPDSIAPTDPGSDSPGKRWWTPSRVKASVALGVIASVVGVSLYHLRQTSQVQTVSGSTCCTVSPATK
ncbi:MAG: PEGA domain-containing protein [Proteobacteria bacterium]|nr:PEGA domain-containing protein [Pseudomonadota bacterium]